MTLAAVPLTPAQQIDAAADQLAQAHAALLAMFPAGSTVDAYIAWAARFDRNARMRPQRYSAAAVAQVRTLATRVREKALQLGTRDLHAVWHAITDEDVQAMRQAAEQRIAAENAELDAQLARLRDALGVTSAADAETKLRELIAMNERTEG